MSDPFVLSEKIGLTDISPAIDLRGRTAVITGAADGIGRAVAKAYHSFGANVVAIDVQQAKLDELAKELSGTRITPLQFDLRERNDNAFTNLGKTIETATGGKVDIYVINAGIIKKYDGDAAKKLSTTPMDEADDMFAINTRSHLALYQKILPMMQKSDAGRVVLTSSPIVGRKDPASAHYAWTKKALEDLVSMARSEIRADKASENILVTGYVPPPVQAWLRAHWKNEPLYCNPMPEDVTELPLRLASPKLLPEHDGKMFALVDKRKKDIAPKNGGEHYDANDRTEKGFDLGINVRMIGEGGGTEGRLFLAAYDTWNARQLLGLDAAPPLDENIRLRDRLRPPGFVEEALKTTAAGGPPVTFNQVITTENGKEFKGYIASPKGVDKAPGMILMHEVYGVTEGLKATADKFAEKGFLVLCPNMYWEHDPNASFKYDAADRDAARDLMFKFVKPLDGNLEPQNAKLVSYVEKAADFLRRHDGCDGTVAATGFCFGGRSAYLSLANDAKVDAGIAFYPTPELQKVFSQAAAMQIKKPFMFVAGGADPYITNEEKAAMIGVSRNVLTYVAGRPAPINESRAEGNPNIITLFYGNSDHGWMRADSKKYSDPGAAEHTISAASEFLKAALGQKMMIVPPTALSMPDSPLYKLPPKL